MTIKQFLAHNDWTIECEMNLCRYMCVNVTFLNPDMSTDETSFDILAYDKNELAELYDAFCKENNFPRNTVCGITIVAVADTLEELEQIS